MIQVSAGQLVEVVISFAGVEQITGNHRVECTPATSMPARRSTIMSYFRFCPIFSISAFSSTGRSASSVV